MGGMFFKGSSTSDNSSTYSNPELRAYTEAYRGASPWGFATLDPTATLAAMGDGTKIGNKDLGGGFKQYLEGLSGDEKKTQQASNDALARIRQRQESGQFLTPQETDFISSSLDKAFEYARTTGFQDWQKGVQSLAGGRGLRTSDTPVAEPALKEYRNLQLGLSSKRAELQLGATMDFAKEQQNFDESFRQFNESLSQNRWNARQSYLFGGGLQAASNLGYQSTSHTRNVTTPSVMGSIGMGLSGAQNAASAVSGFMRPST